MRAMSRNSKGVVDRYRRPKHAYDVVKALLHKAGGPAREEAVIGDDDA
jgi:hypothetical protein